MAEKVLANAQAVYKEATSLLSEAYNLIVPNIDLTYIQRKAEQHSEEALRLKDNAEKLTNEHAEVISYYHCY